MALTSNLTLSSQLGLSSNLVTLSAVTGITAGMFGQIDGEQVQVSKAYVAGANPVLLGTRGIASIAAVHEVGARAVFGLAADFASPAPGGPLTTLAEQPGQDRTSAGATLPLVLPQGGRNLQIDLAGATATAYTLANPTQDMDGCILTLSSIAKLAHTVTYTAGLGNVGATADVLTWKSDQTQTCQLIAKAGFWNGLSGIVAGAATIAGVGLG